MSAAPGIVLLAGTLTFGNEWYQTGQPNWRVVPATLLGAWGFTALDKLSPTASVGLASIVLIGALTTRFSGKAPLDELNTVLKTAKRG